MAGMGSSIPAGSFLVAAAAILAILATQATSVDEQIAWGSIALTALFIGLAYVMSAITGYGALGLVSWRLGPWLLVYGAVTFGLTTLSWTGPQTGVSAQILPSSVVRALGLTAVGAILLTAGYCVGPYRLTSYYMRRAKRTLSAIN